MSANKTWQVWIDTGGTFTDCLAIDPDGKPHRRKVLSACSLRGSVEEIVGDGLYRVSRKWNAPDDFLVGFRFRVAEMPDLDGEILGFDSQNSVLRLSETEPKLVGLDFEATADLEAPALAARLVTNTPACQAPPPMRLRLATTRGTNALLEGKGEPPLFLVTEGFRDLLEIGDQRRPDLFALEIKKTRMPLAHVVEFPERLGANGKILKPLNKEELRQRIKKVDSLSKPPVAVALLHSYLNPVHEQETRELLLECGFTDISLSSDLAPLIQILPRAQTAVVNATLARVIEDYLIGVASGIGEASLAGFHVMTSAGGLVSREFYKPKDSLLSGPAGGALGASIAGRRAGFNRTIAFDMGGTSADVSRFDGALEYVFEHQVGAAHLVAPALAIQTVAAGGGSICQFDGNRLRVGPESAGSRPGPACYGLGGPLTLTDVNLLLGRLDPTIFEIPVHEEPALARLNEILDHLEVQTGAPMTRNELLEGFLRIANERMAEAVRQVSVRQGYNPAEYALVAFGGAGGQHACALAEILEINSVVIPEDAGILSALGLGYAEIERIAESQVLLPLDKLADSLEDRVQALQNQASAELQEEGFSETEIQLRRRIFNLRFAGQDSTLAIESDDLKALGDEFVRKHDEIFGHSPKNRSIEIESIRIVMGAGGHKVELAEETPSEPFAAKPDGHRLACFDGKEVQVETYLRKNLTQGAEFHGPALVLEDHCSTVVQSGWRGYVHSSGGIILRRKRSS